MKKNHIAFLLLIIANLFIVSVYNSYSQFSKPGPQVETFYSVIDDSEQPYGLYLPKDFNPEKTYPLVIMLHGAGSNHRLALKRVFGKSNKAGENDVEASRYFPEWDNVEYIVASPYARGTMGYQGIPEADVVRVIEECKKNFNIDENRVYLTGLSMGGGGTLYFGLTHPDLFAAIAALCPAPPPDAYDLLGNALNMQVALYQGSADPLVNPEGTRSIYKEMKDMGTSVEYNEYPNVGHNVWEYAYKNGAVFKWFDNIVRNPFPDRVRYTTKWYKYNSAYWVLIDKMTPGILSTIDAQFKGENTVKTTGIEAFTLTLKGHSKFSVQKALTATINGQIVQSSSKYNHSFILKDGKWTTEKYIAPFVSKQQGLEGPLAAAIYDRHIYVYGTGGNPTNEELQKRREIATQAATFSGGFGGGVPAVNPRVVSDKNIRASDYETSNLVLFGTKETNLVIEKFSSRLPVQLNADSTGYGLVYCFPIDGHYVVISSGIPFWTTRPVTRPTASQPATAAAPAARPVRTAVNFGAGTGARALMNFKDFLLFKGTNDNIISDGYFDQNWKLPVEGTDKLKASGVVTISEK
jgi:poly(3-hydroxybutyrate) depolymerase